MMRKLIISLLTLLCAATSTFAQEGRTIEDVELLNLYNIATRIPNFGLKNILIFYVDPDRVGQNDDFVREIKDNATLKNGTFTGVNIMNTKDAPNTPHAVAYKMAQKRAEESGTPFLIDRDGTLANAWRLGDCDNYSVIMVVNTSGVIKFISKGKITPSNKERFFRIIEEM